MLPEPSWPTRCPSCGKDGDNELCSNAWHYVAREPPAPEDAERAKAVGRERGWLVGEKWIWEDE